MCKVRLRKRNVKQLFANMIPLSGAELALILRRDRAPDMSMETISQIEILRVAVRWALASQVNSIDRPVPTLIREIILVSARQHVSTSICIHPQASIRYRIRLSEVTRSSDGDVSAAYETVRIQSEKAESVVDFGHAAEDGAVAAFPDDGFLQALESFFAFSI
jgi:hypothetical protein